MTSKLELLQFETADKLNLPGLLYQPEPKTKRAAIFIHGMTASVFDSVHRTNALGEALIKRGIAFLAFNNRGSGMVSSIKSYVKGKKRRIKAGFAYELIKDSIKDIDGALAFLRQQAYKEIYLIGHSSGANKICVYNFYKPKNLIKKYVLVAGGDDTGLAHEELGHKEYTRSLLRAETQINKHRGEDMADVTLMGGRQISHQSLFDILNPDGDYNIFPFLEVMGRLQLSTQPLFRHFKSIKKPTLLVYGSDDEHCWGKVPQIIDILTQQSSAAHKLDSKIIESGLHDFNGQEEQLAKIIADWL